MAYSSMHQSGIHAYICTVGYGQGLILCQLLPGREYKGSGLKPPGFDSKLVAPDPATGSIVGLKI